MDSRMLIDPSWKKAHCHCWFMINLLLSRTLFCKAAFGQLAPSMWWWGPELFVFWELLVLWGAPAVLRVVKDPHEDLDFWMWALLQLSEEGLIYSFLIRQLVADSLHWLFCWLILVTLPQAERDHLSCSPVWRVCIHVQAHQMASIPYNFLRKVQKYFLSTWDGPLFRVIFLIKKFFLSTLAPFDSQLCSSLSYWTGHHHLSLFHSQFKTLH